MRTTVCFSSALNVADSAVVPRATSPEASADSASSASRANASGARRRSLVNGVTKGTYRPLKIGSGFMAPPWLTLTR